jgi:D-alanyl-lipoteichoic acid acyltransferase DltB (MBOAT superfamily)
MNGWSIIASAQANSNLAGILAGFLFFGLIYLLGKDEKRSEIVLLFTASFIILAFAGYLFSRVSGFSASSDPGPAIASFCKGVWMEGMIAYAMLVVGTATMIVGLGYVLVSYDPKSDRTHLRRLATVTTGGILVGAIFLLFTSVNFYDELLDRPNHHLIWALSVLAIMLVLSLSYVTYTSSRGPGGRRQIRDKYIEWAVYVIGGFGIAGTVLTGIAARVDPSRWVSWLVIIASLGFPAIIVVMLAGGTVDGKDERARVKEEEEKAPAA